MMLKYFPYGWISLSSVLKLPKDMSYKHGCQVFVNGQLTDKYDINDKEGTLVFKGYPPTDKQYYVAISYINFQEFANEYDNVMTHISNSLGSLTLLFKAFEEVFKKKLNIPEKEYEDMMKKEIDNYLRIIKAEEEKILDLTEKNKISE